MKTLFCIVGRSGSGKDSLVREVEKLGYKQIISYATRPRREGEGDTHIFITPEEVVKYRHDFVARTQIGNFEYFSTRSQLQEADLYIIDPLGVKYLKEKVKDIKIVVIYIQVPFEECKKRALARGDQPIVVAARLSSEDAQFTKFEKHNEYEHVVINDNFDHALEELKKIILENK